MILEGGREVETIQKKNWTVFRPENHDIWMILEGGREVKTIFWKKKKKYGFSTKQSWFLNDFGGGVEKSKLFFVKVRTAFRLENNDFYVILEGGREVKTIF